MAKDTKEKILFTALDLFSENGYSNTNLQMIADRVGIVKSALYRHFSSKEDLYNSLLDKLQAYYYERFNNNNNDLIINSTKQLFEMTIKMVDFTIHDDKIKKTRKILLMEQFKDERIKKLASEHFIFSLNNTYTKIFTHLIENKIIKDIDPNILALEFTSPITQLIHLSDRQPELLDECIKKIISYVKHFIDIYSV